MLLFFLLISSISLLLVSNTRSNSSTIRSISTSVIEYYTKFPLLTDFFIKSVKKLTVLMLRSLIFPARSRNSGRHTAENSLLQCWEMILDEQFMYSPHFQYTVSIYCRVKHKAGYVFLNHL